MDQPLTKEESYVERRQLFKNIWHTAMDVGEKDDVLNKPKVIKTLRLDEVDQSGIGNKKKQRIRNLRAVCNKLLEFCDRQDEDDLIYEQLISSVRRPRGLHLKSKKLKPHQEKRRIKKIKSQTEPPNETADPRATTSNRTEEKNVNLAITTKVSRITSPIRRVHVKNSPFILSKVASRKINQKNIQSSTKNISTGATQLKTIVKPEQSKRNSSLETIHKIAQKFHRQELEIGITNIPPI